MMAVKRSLQLCTALFLFVAVVLAKSKKKGDTVVEKGLVSKAMTAKDVLTHHSSFSKKNQHKKRFSGTSLMYVTPWNNHGYTTARMFAGKLDFVSPVWLQLRRQGKKFTVTGDHDIDTKWMQDVKKNGRTKIVPRILFDQWTPEDFHAVFTNEYVGSVCARTIIDFYKKHDFDGLVLEFWLQYGRRPDEAALHFLDDLGKDLKAEKKTFIIAVPPPLYMGGYPGIFTRDHFQRLAKVVDFFSLMTYDYSPPENYGPNSPYFWVENCLNSLASEEEFDLRKKILVGFNFYGNVYYNGRRGGAILGKEYLEILQKHSPEIRWDSSAEEHIAEFVKNGYGAIVYFPSLFSIKRRLELAKSHGVGVSIWEGGQGLDYFFDLF